MSNRKQPATRTANNPVIQEFQRPRSFDANDLENSIIAGQAVAKRAQEHKISSLLQPLQCPPDTTQLLWKDLTIERLLGRGRYGIALLAEVEKLDSEQAFQRCVSPDSTVDSNDDSTNSSERSIPKHYAVKRLDPKKIETREDFETAAADLYTEGFLLSRLNHDNIIQLRGVSANDISKAYLCEGGYFLVLEALDRTLDNMLHEWRHHQEDRLVRNSSSSMSGNETRIPSLHHRITKIALGIVKGMEYLHGKQIMFRDLKPSNVGMSEDGQIKIFDFGLAREAHPRLPHGDEAVVKGAAGSLRYIAPENLLGEGCYFSGDVYSFGILLWELCSLSVPFQDMTRVSDFVVDVAGEGRRPKIRSIVAPSAAKSLIKACWADDRHTRPTFKEARSILESVREEEKTTRKSGGFLPVVLKKTQGLNHFRSSGKFWPV